MIVYYAKGIAKHCGFGTEDCYICPAKKCTPYLDGVVRCEITQEQLNALKQRKHIKILKVIGGSNNGN